MSQVAYRPGGYTADRWNPATSGAYRRRVALSTLKTRLIRSPVLGGPARRARLWKMRSQAKQALGTRDPVLQAVFQRLGHEPTDPTARQWSDRIEAERAALLGSDEPVTNLVGMEWGQVHEGETRPVSQVCSASKDRMFGLLLYDLIRTVHPRRVLEMGTCVGISSAYMAAALTENGDDGRVVTLEGQAAYIPIARRVHATLGLTNVDIVEGLFDDTLPGVLETAVDFAFVDGFHQEIPTLAYFDALARQAPPHATLVFDDITWNDGMRRAWAKIRASDLVDLAVDLRSLGVVRVR